MISVDNNYRGARVYLRIISMKRGFAFLVALVGVTACSNSFPEVKASLDAAVASSRPERTAGVSVLLKQCERMVRGQAVDVNALTRAGFQNANGTRYGTYSKTIGTFENALKQDVDLTMAAIFIDRLRYNELAAQGRKNIWGIGCSTGDITGAEAMSFLVAQGYKLHVTKRRGETLVTKGSVNFILSLERTVYGPHSTFDNVAFVIRKP